MRLSKLLKIPILKRNNKKKYNLNKNSINRKNLYAKMKKLMSKRRNNMKAINRNVKLRLKSR